MKANRIILLVALLISTVTFAAARAGEHPKKTEHPAKTEHPTDTGGLLAVAGKAGNFKTFIAAVEAAGLTGEFQAKGPFTVFAPTDEAFAKLPKGAVEDLLKPANKAKLAGILAYHVVPGKIMSADVKTMKATNISGLDLAIVVGDGAVTCNGAKLVKVDLVGANGVIHGIDTVLMPEASTEHPASDKPKDHPAH